MVDDSRRQQIATSYLAHILIALKAGDRGAPFRDFLDNWYAYEIGGEHLTSGGRPIWFNNPCARTHQKALSEMHFVSRQASHVLVQAKESGPAFSLLRSQKDQKIRLMMGHAIPLTVVVGMMFEGEEIRSLESIDKFLKRFYRLGILTFEENLRLDKMGLRSRMPDRWDRENAFARYDAAGIERNA